MDNPPPSAAPPKSPKSTSTCPHSDTPPARHRPAASTPAENSVLPPDAHLHVPAEPDASTSQTARSPVHRVRRAQSPLFHRHAKNHAPLRPCLRRTRSFLPELSAQFLPRRVRSFCRPRRAVRAPP